MKAEHAAIVAFWQRLGMPVHMQGEVRDPAAQFPFVTITMGRSSFGYATSLTAFVWLKDDGQGATERRADLMDAVEVLLPENGVLLHTGKGSVLLERGVEFLMVYDDPDINSHVIGFRVSYTARFFVR